MKLVFLYGLPATGKLTVAQELASLTGYKLFHNHLVVDLLLSVFEFGSEPFVALREDIWLSVFEEAAVAQLPGLIFTFNPESSVTPGFVNTVVETLTESGVEVDFIELQCPLPELRARMASEERQHFRKLTSVALFDQLHAQGVFDTSHMPKPKLTIDTSTYTAAQVAAQIIQTLELSQIAPSVVNN